MMQQPNRRTICCLSDTERDLPHAPEIPEGEQGMEKVRKILTTGNGGVQN
jgi:hypothetical protein